jgi:alanine racemase
MSDDVGDAGRLTIDLDAVVANWRLLRDRAQGAECAAVVKADAYGVGAAEVVDSLVQAGCRSFFVAQCAEALHVRARAVQANIYVINGLYPQKSAFYQEHNLIPVISSRAEAEEWVSARGRTCALHIDTGMNRLGVSAQDAVFLSTLEGFAPVMVMSHFVASERADDPLNRRQCEEFERLAALFPNAMKSMANSSGIFLPHRPHYDLVRPGYALYGGNPTPDKANPMRPVIGLQVPILQIRQVDTGARVGYNGTWRALRPSRLATINAGYADGVLRSGSGTDRGFGAQVFVSNRFCPFVGRISMDLSVIDITGLDHVQRGDVVEVLGPNISVDALGTAAHTIGYEVLTSLGQRYSRKYIKMTS